MTPDMTPDEAWTLLAAERRAFADLLDSLEPDQWQTPSLCEGWSVRDVAAHMMVGPAGNLGAFLKAMVVARGRFDVANRVLATGRSARPTSEIAGDFRRLAESRFTPPTMDWRAPLTDFLVHRLDVIVPLGLSAGGTSHAWPDALQLVVSKKGKPSFRKRDLPLLTCRATDVDWVHGEGPTVTATAEVLALALTGRPHRLDELTGPGADTLRSWARGR